MLIISVTRCPEISEQDRSAITRQAMGGDWNAVEGQLGAGSRYIPFLVNSSCHSTCSTMSFGYLEKTDKILVDLVRSAECHMTRMSRFTFTIVSNNALIPNITSHQSYCQALIIACF